MSRADLTPPLIWQARQWLVFCAKTIEAQAPDFWNDLKTEVQNLVEKCGLSPTAFYSKLPTDFHVHDPLIPSFDLAVTLDVEAHTLRYITKRTIAREVPRFEVTGRLPFHLDDAGELYLKQGETILNVYDSAALLLRPLLEKYRVEP